MLKHEKKRVTVFDGEQYDGDWPTPYPTLLVDAIAWFQERLDEIPKEYQASARCEIDSASGGEGDHYGHIEISYDRPETDEELSERRAREQQKKINLRDRDLAMLNVLRAKYPDE